MSISDVKDADIFFEESSKWRVGARNEESWGSDSESLCRIRAIASKGSTPRDQSYTIKSEAVPKQLMPNKVTINTRVRVD